MIFECRVSDITPLRVPKVHRVKSTCGEVEIEVELHEDAVKVPSRDSRITVEITSSKEECLKHYFCGHGYVVSNTLIGDVYRVVISLHGFLVVVKSKNRLELNELDRVYVGATY